MFAHWAKVRIQRKIILQPTFMMLFLGSYHQFKLWLLKSRGNEAFILWFWQKDYIYHIIIPTGNFDFEKGYSGIPIQRFSFIQYIIIIVFLIVWRYARNFVCIFINIIILFECYFWFVQLFFSFSFFASWLPKTKIMIKEEIRFHKTQFKL